MQTIEPQEVLQGPRLKRKYIYTKKTGRPKGQTKYTPEFIERQAAALDKYCKSFKGKNLRRLPLLSDFCYKQGYYSELISITFSKNETFLKSLKMFKDFQESYIAQMAATRQLDVTMCIFTLKNTSGWRDKTEVDHQNQGTNIVIIRNGSTEPAIPGRAEQRLPG